MRHVQHVSDKTTFTVLDAYSGRLLRRPKQELENMTFQIALEPNYSAFVRVCEQFSAPSSSDPSGFFRELEKTVFFVGRAWFSAWFSAGGGSRTRRKTKLHFFTFLGKGWSTLPLGPQRNQKEPQKNQGPPTPNATYECWSSIPL